MCVCGTSHFCTDLTFKKVSNRQEEKGKEVHGCSEGHENAWCDRRGRYRCRVSWRQMTRYGDPKGVIERSRLFLLHCSVSVFSPYCFFLVPIIYLTSIIKSIDKAVSQYIGALSYTLFKKLKVTFRKHIRSCNSCIYGIAPFHKCDRRFHCRQPATPFSPPPEGDLNLVTGWSEYLLRHWDMWD